MKTTTEKTLAQFIAENNITAKFVPVQAAQETESQFKTWQLHYVAVVTVGERSESFDWRAGYGCAVHQLKDRLAKHRGSMIYTREPLLSKVTEQVALAIAKGTDANRLLDKAQCRAVMQWLLNEYKPTLADVLNGLKLDASLGENSFHDFCGELGESEDSRKAELSWRSCQENGRKVRGLIGAKAFVELLNETESL